MRTTGVTNLHTQYTVHTIFSNKIQNCVERLTQCTYGGRQKIAQICILYRGKDFFCYRTKTVKIVFLIKFNCDLPHFITLHSTMNMNTYICIYTYIHLCNGFENLLRMAEYIASMSSMPTLDLETVPIITYITKIDVAHFFD